MIDIQDNFLHDGEFEHLYKMMMSYNVLWEASKIVDDAPHNMNRNMQMCHFFYDRHAPTDKTIEILYPVLQKMQPCAMIKCKANMVMGTDRIVEHGMHIDILDAEDRPYIMTSILYMNTCDGYTLFEDGTKVKSVANRFVTFPNNMRHTGTSTTDSSFRMVINFNYV